MAVVLHPGLNAPARPRVSVCIANYNGEALLPACIDSVLAQDIPEALEILVHDDASSDRSLALLRERYPQVRVLVSEENVGFCKSNNRMVEHANGEFVLLLNNDATLAPDAIGTLLDAARTSPRHGILTLPQYDWLTGDLVDRGCLLDPFYNPAPNVDPGRQDVAYVIGACLWIPKQLWDELGGFPEWMESLAEDMFLCCTARLKGFAVQCVSSSGYWHRQGASFGGNRVGADKLSSTYRRRRLSERNKSWTLFVCTPSAAVWPLAAAHALLLAIEGVVLSLLRLDLHAWKSIYSPTLTDIFESHTRLREQRSRIQASRRIGLASYWRPFVATPRKLQLLFRHGFPYLGK